MCRYNTTSPTPYDQVRPLLLNPLKETTLVSDSESIPSPCASPPQTRRHYGESITNLGKASIMGEHTGKGYSCTYGKHKVVFFLITLICVSVRKKNQKSEKEL